MQADPRQLARVRPDKKRKGTHRRDGARAGASGARQPGPARRGEVRGNH